MMKKYATLLHSLNIAYVVIIMCLYVICRISIFDSLNICHLVVIIFKQIVWFHTKKCSNRSPQNGQILNDYAISPTIQARCVCVVVVIN